MPPKKKGLGPAFSCRLREDQDRIVRADAEFHGITKVEALRRRLDTARAVMDDKQSMAASSGARHALCGLCGKRMPPGEEMFNYHGHSGPCPTESGDADSD